MVSPGSKSGRAQFRVPRRDVRNLTAGAGGLTDEGSGGSARRERRGASFKRAAVERRGRGQVEA